MAARRMVLSGEQQQMIRAGTGKTTQQFAELLFDRPGVDPAPGLTPAPDLPSIPR